MPAVTAIVGVKRYPMVVPQAVKYPALCFQVLENLPDKLGRRCHEDLSLRAPLGRDLAYQRGPAGVHGRWRLAATCIGDSDPTVRPSGLSGWTDDEASLWLLQDSFDEMGQIVAGQDVSTSFRRQPTLRGLFTSCPSGQRRRGILPRFPESWTLDPTEDAHVP